MYETFYSLNANPFRLTPDPRFCFSHPGYQRAREYLVYALRLGEGFIVVTGQPGTGKTTLAETFLKELEVNKVAAERIVASNFGAMGLLRSVAFAFGLPAENIDRATLRSHIEQSFTQRVRGGRRVLLIIDEAQGLPHSALEELRLLADLQSGTQPLLQIFLIGQHSLKDLLQVPEMNQFQQRVIATCHLQPLSLADTSAYMEYRLIQAGWKGDPEFTGEAVLSIYRYSQGLPRHINKLCNRLLLIGYGKEKHTIDQEDVEDISTEMRLEKLSPIFANKSGRNDLSEVPFETELPDDRSSLDSLALRSGGSAIEAPDMAVEAEPSAEPGACSYSGETADWPVEVAAAACRPEQTEQLEQPEHQPATSLAPAEKASAALYRWAMPAKRSLGGIGHRLAKSVMVAAVVSMAALTRFAVAAKRSLGGIGQRLAKSVIVVAVVSTTALTRFAAVAKRSLGGIGHRLVKSVIVVAVVSMTALTRFAVVAKRSLGGIGHRLAKSVIVVAVVSTAVLTRFAVAAKRSLGGIGQRLAKSVRQASVVSMAALTRFVVVAKRSLGGIGQRLAKSVRQAAVVSTTALTRFAVVAKRSLEGIGRLPVTPVLTAVALVTAFVSTVALTRFHEIQPVASLQDTGVAVNEAVSFVTPAEKPVAVPPEPDEPLSVLAAPSRPVTAVPSPGPAPVSESREARIARLLGRARQSLERDRLLVPAGDNASLYYNRVLALDPDNRAALDGIDRIAGRYAELASYASWQQDSGKARLYLERGLQVQPDNAELMVLRTTLERPPASGAEVVDRSIVASKEPPKPFFSQMKDLLGIKSGTVR